MFTSNIDGEVCILGKEGKQVNDRNGELILNKHLRADCTQTNTDLKFKQNKNSNLFSNSIEFMN